MDKDELWSSNFEQYLEPNLTYDVKTSDNVLNKRLHDVSLSIGMVQAGERIVDRGEVVDAKTYNILRSFSSKATIAALKKAVEQAQSSSN